MKEKLINKYQNYFGKEKMGEITSFRLEVLFLYSIGLGIITPILIMLKGLYIPAAAISILIVMQTLSVKLNSFLIKRFTIQRFYDFGIVIHFIYIVVCFIYFIDPSLMIWIDSIIAIIEVLIFSSFSIVLNTYITDCKPKIMTEFQIKRNGIGADSYVVGLLISSVLTFLYPVSYAIVVYIIFNILFNIYMIYNRKIYLNCEYCNKIH